MNVEMLDRNGEKISLGDQVKIYQYAQSILFIQPSNDPAFIENLNKHYDISSPKNNLELIPYGNEFMIVENGKPSVMEKDESFTVKSPFLISSEYDIPEMNVKKGDDVLCFGGEGYAAGVFRYDDYTLEIIKI